MSSSIVKARGWEQREGPALDFEGFFEAERGRLFRLLVLVTGSTDEAEDLVQEAFFRVWELWARVSELENPAGYLHRIAMNRFRSRYRHAVYAAKRRLSIGGDAPDPLAAVEARDAALRALRLLTRRQRAAVIPPRCWGTRWRRRPWRWQSVRARSGS
jgi:DNA-directed RNA polymerase specialized sigma24 family protein